MKNNLIVILCFTAGIFCGTFANTTISTYCEKLPQFLLYALVIQVGLNLGANAELGKMVKDIRFSSLLLPFFTIIGTLVFSAAASLLLTSWNIYDCMAVGSGFAYYSLSSLLIVQLKEASAGIEIASQLGAIALLANIIREMLALFGAPLYALTDLLIYYFSININPTPACSSVTDYLDRYPHGNCMIILFC